MIRIFRKKYECVIQRSGDDYILVPVIDSIATMNKVYTLNELGFFIWNCIDGISTLENIIEKITTEYDVDRQTATTDTLAFLDKIDFLVEVMQ